MTTPDIDLDADARIARLEEMEARATRAPWSVRPQEFDDWGYVRGPVDQDGFRPVVATARAGRHVDLDAHRKAGTDPYEPNAALIATVRNDLPWLLEQARAFDRLEEAMAAAYQAVGVLIYHFGLSDNPDCIRIQDMLAYGKTKDGVDLLPWPREPLPSEHDALRKDRDELVETVARLQQENADLAGEIARLREANRRLDSLQIAVAICTNDRGLTDFGTLKRAWFYAATGRDEPIGDRPWAWLEQEARAARLANTERTNDKPDVSKKTGIVDRSAAHVDTRDMSRAAVTADTERSEPAPKPPACQPLPFAPDDVEIETYRIGEFAGQVNAYPIGVRVTHRPTGLSATSEAFWTQRHNWQAAFVELGRLLRADTERSDADGR